MTQKASKKKVIQIISVLLSVVLLIASCAVIFTSMTSGTKAAEPTWQEYLDSIWKERTSDWQYASNTGGAPVWNGSISAPPLVGTTYQISTGAQLAWIAQQCNAGNKFTGLEVRLMNSLDLGGKNGVKWTRIGLSDTNFFDGTFNGGSHTIYNMKINELVAYQGLFGITSRTAIVKNLTMESARVEVPHEWVSVVVGGHIMPHLGYETTAAMENVVVKNSYLKALNWTAPLVGDSSSYDVKNCAAIDNVVYGGDHVGGAIVMGVKVTNSFSTGSLVISTGTHSGGFISCTNRVDLISNCFTNNEVYGTARTGAFIGNNDQTSRENVSPGVFENCYASGSIEGVDEIGGFIGSNATNGVDPRATIKFRNCYSTSIVGMRNGGKRMGGFIGNSLHPYITFENCYAAGETGSIDTEVGAGRTNFLTVGGFIGAVEAHAPAFINNYYDKQTTAMREWGIGSTVNKPGITGMLTTTTAKSGVGMTEGSWNALGSAYVSQEEYYPQNTVFANAAPANWQTQERADLVKAYSKASVSTVHLATYDKDVAGNALPQATYDTVRDLTSRFPMTKGGNLAWERAGDSNNLANGSGNTTTLYGETKDILTLYPGTPVLGGDYWASDFAPGIEWLRVNVEIGGQTGYRQLRIIPTSNVDAGKNKTISAGKSYDHADDMRMAFSTAPRMAVKKDDFTYGVYPDNPLEASQLALLTKSAYPGIPPTFATDNDLFRDTNSLYMERSSSSGLPTPTSLAGGKINEVKIQPMEEINPDGTFKLGTPLDLTNSSIAAQWNGHTPFSAAISGKHYLVTYYWSLADGRFMTGSKLVKIDTSPKNVKILAQVPEGTENPNYAQLDAYSLVDDNGDPIAGVKPSFITNSAEAPKGNDATKQPMEHGAAVAWKALHSNWTTSKVTITLDHTALSAAGTISKSVVLTGSQIPTAANPMTEFEFTFPHVGMKLSALGEYVLYETNVTQKYKVLYDKGIYKIEFAGEFDLDGSIGTKVIEVAQDILVEVVLAPPATVDLSVATPDDAKYTGLDKPALVASGDFKKFGSVEAQTNKVPTNPSTSNLTYSKKSIAYAKDGYNVWVGNTGYVAGNIFVTDENGKITQVYLGGDGNVYTSKNATAGTEYKVTVDNMYDAAGTPIYAGLGTETITWSKAVDGTHQLTFPKVAYDYHVDVSFAYDLTEFQITKKLNKPALVHEDFVFMVEYLGNDKNGPGTVRNVMYGTVSVLAGADQNSINFGKMPTGWYRVTELDSNWRYTLDIGKLTSDNPVGKVGTNRDVSYWVDTANTNYIFTNNREDKPYITDKGKIINELPPVSEYRE